MRGEKGLVVGCSGGAVAVGMYQVRNASLGSLSP